MEKPILYYWAPCPTCSIATHYATEHGIELKIAGIVRPRKGVAATSISGAIGYTKALTDLILEKNSQNEVINQQKDTPEHNVLTGLKFERTIYTKDNIGELIRTIDSKTMNAIYAFMTEQIHAMFEENPPVNAESFIGFAAMMNNEQLSTLITQMLGIAKANPANTMSLKMLTMALSQMMPGVEITPDNLVVLLPAMSIEQIMVAIGGIPKSEQVPMDIKGLQAMCGEEAMTEIYKYMNEQLLLMSVDDTNFTTLLRVMDDEQFDTFQNTLYDLAPQTDATLDSNLALMGDALASSPSSINFFAVDFEAKEYLEDKKVSAAVAHVAWNRDADYYATADWRGKWESEGGGLLINQALHTLDLLQWLAGKPESLVASVSNLTLDGVVEVEDTAVILGEGKARLSFFATNGAGEDLPVEITVKTDAGILKILPKAVLADGELHTFESNAPVNGKVCYGNSHGTLIADFYRCIAENRPFPINGREGAEVVRLILAAYESRGKRTAVR